MGSSRERGASLVLSLRAWASYNEPGSDVYEDAADEIERLQGALKLAVKLIADEGTNLYANTEAEEYLHREVLRYLGCNEAEIDAAILRAKAPGILASQ